MKRTKSLLVMAVAAVFVFTSCGDTGMDRVDEVSPEVLTKLAKAGFNVQDQAPIAFDEGYLVEGDIYIPAAQLDQLRQGDRLPSEEQYSTNNLVNAGGGRVITIYAEEEGGTDGGGGGKGGGKKPKNSISDAAFGSAMIAGLDEAIARFNAENLTISFQRVTSSTGADIIMTRLGKRDERRGVLGSAGFPTASGDPYGEIKMSGVLQSQYGLGVDGIATIIAHEMGHCVGFRHTDYFDRSISCGSGGNEGDAGVGANLIPGTPAGASAADASWMLACTDGSNRPFNNDDQTALDFLY